MNKEQQKIHEEARKRFTLVCDTEAAQRIREVEDLKFQVPELQWSEEARAQRQGGSVTGVPFQLPPRPMLSIPKLRQPIQLVRNQERTAKLGVNIHPLSEDAERDTAEALQGLYRKIERDSNAHQARSWAFERAVQAGRGCYRVNLEYDEDSPYPFDMRICIDRILYQENVFFDPAAQLADWSDGNWAFNVAWLPKDVFEREYPKSKFSSADPFEFKPAETDAPLWVRGDGDSKAYLVAEYFYKEYAGEMVYLVGNGAETAIVGGPEAADLIKKLPNGFKVLKERERKIPTVKWCKLTGAEVLEQRDWDGRHIPLIPVIGNELVPFDGERRWEGLVSPAKDAQRMFNYGASGLVEMAALEPRAPWIATPEQLEGYEAWWAQSNTRNFPYLPYNGRQDQPPPARVQVDTNRMGPSLMMVQQADDFIQSSTGTFDAALGTLPAKERSGKAIMALQQQSDAGNSHYVQNLAHISMMYEAKVILDLIPVVYERPGRVSEILDETDNSKSVMFNMPFVRDEQGRPRQAGPTAKSPKMYDLNKGRYGVSVSIGKSYQSRLQAGAEELGQILQSAPQLMPIIGPVYFKFRDFPGSPEVAKLLEKLRDMQFPNLATEEDGQPNAQQMKAMLQKAGQEVQMLRQQLQAAVKELETEQAKQQATIAKAQIDSQAKLQQTKEQNESKAALEEFKADTERALKQMEQRFEAIQNSLDRQHEIRLEGFKARTAAAQAERQDDREDAREARRGDSDE